MIEVPLDMAVRMQATLAKPVYGSSGQIMVQKGNIITRRYADNLQRLGVFSVYINAGGIDNEPVICETVRLRATKIVNNITKSQEKTEIKDIIEKILSDILYFKGVVDAVSNISTYDGYTFTHSVDVCVLAISIGYHMGFERASLLEIGTGALLHDVGKLKIPSCTINKQGKLDDEEFAVIKNHSRLGYELIKNHPQVSPRAACMVLEHHERYDGSGYPKRKSGKNIHLFSAICGVADVYNAMTTNRSYRKAYAPHEVYEMILGMGDTHFSFKVVQAFAKCVSPYPRGTFIRVSNGRIALVENNKSEHPYLPNVIYADDESDTIVNLHSEGLTVIGPVLPEELGHLQKVSKHIQEFSCAM